MQRHYNFLPTVGSIPFDGNGNIKVYQDIKLQYSDGDYPLTQGMIHAGALVYLTNSLRSGKTPLEQSKTLVSPKGLWSGVADGKGGAGDGRQFWYTEYNYNSSLSSVLNGGVAACSSQDLVSWRFEGIVFHYTNLSDMVYGTGSSDPFTHHSLFYYHYLQTVPSMWRGPKSCSTMLLPVMSCGQSWTTTSGHLP